MEIDLVKGDAIYFFSDEYPDQFGGSKGQNYKCAALKKFLLSIQKLSLKEQQNLQIKNLKIEAVTLNKLVMFV